MWRIHRVIPSIIVICTALGTAAIGAEEAGHDPVQSSSSLVDGMANLDDESIDLLIKLEKIREAALAYEKRGDLLLSSGDFKGSIALYEKARNLLLRQGHPTSVVDARIDVARYRVTLSRKIIYSILLLIGFTALGYMVIGKVLIRRAFLKGKAMLNQQKTREAIEAFRGVSSMGRKPTDEFREMIELCTASDLRGPGMQAIYGKALSLGIETAKDGGPLKFHLARAMAREGRNDDIARRLYDDIMSECQDPEILRFVADEDYKIVEERVGQGRHEGS